MVREQAQLRSTRETECKAIRFIDWEQHNTNTIEKQIWAQYKIGRASPHCSWGNPEIEEEKKTIVLDINTLHKM